VQELLWAPVIGFVAGFVGTMLGIGGGAIMVPGLTLLGFDIKRVVPASLFAILGTSSGGLRYLLRRGLVDYKLAVILELASTTGAFTGVAVFGRIRSSELVAILGAVLILSGVFFILRQRVVARMGGEKEYHGIRIRERLGSFLAALAASYVAGLFSAMPWAMFCSITVLPVRGGATINARCPLPSGVSRSITRVVNGSGPVSRRNH